MDAWQFLTFLVALTVAWVAIQQWWINREKLRLDLFERRYAVYDSAYKFIASILREGGVDQTEQREFWEGTIEGVFLFDSDVNEYLEELRKQSIQLHYHAISQKSAGDDHAMHTEREGALLNWFATQVSNDGMVKVFNPYLRFQDLEGPFSGAKRRIIASWRNRPGAKKNQA